MEISDARKLKALEDENRKLKKLLAETILGASTLKEMLGKTSDAQLAERAVTWAIREKKSAAFREIFDTMRRWRASSSLKTERSARKTYRTRDEAKSDVFDYIECFYNPKRRHSTIGYLSPVEFEMKAGFA